MPTFIIFKNGSAVETIKGADPRALAAAIEKACRGAKAAKAAYTYSSQGHTLGGGPARGGASLGRPLDIKGYFDAVVAFLGLYVYSLFALDAYSSAEKSPFNVNGVAWEVSLLFSLLVCGGLGGFRGLREEGVNGQCVLLQC